MNDKIIKGVYCLTFPNGKRYVGVGCSKGGIHQRWKKYKYLTCKSQPKIYNALKKYGPENVKFEVILETDDVDNALRSEMYLIDVWNLQDIRYGYNINDGGRGNNGYKHSKERIEKIRNSLLGRKWTEEQRIKYKNSVQIPPMTGKKHSDDTKELMSKQRKGVPKSENQKNKMRIITKNLHKTNGFFINNKGNNHIQAKIRKIKNIITGDILEGCLKQLGRDLNQNVDSFRTSMKKYGRYRDWILLDGN
jgi:group I intron endonuclease